MNLSGLLLSIIALLIAILYALRHLRINRYTNFFAWGAQAGVVVSGFLLLLMWL